MIEIALASGFGSVRRFNETFQELFGRPPAALRRSPRQEPGVEAGALSVRASAIGRPMIGTRCCRSSHARAIPGVEIVARR